jgi:SAM-dependent MidA family methyltransferase
VTATATPRTPLARELLRQIHARGPLSFAEFMRECLYHPTWGYYSRADAVRFADFYTSVDVHPIFARLLARQVAEMWERLGRPKDFCVAEGAAGTGRLASQFLDFAARQFPDFYQASRYLAVEISAARRAAHAAAFPAHLAAGRVDSAAELPQTIPCGCIFSNELLDALPVHRVVCQHGQLREVYVTAEGETLREELGPLSTPGIEEFFREQGVSLREGQQAEAGLAACEWIEQSGARLGRGFLLTVDYGHQAQDLYNERHQRGTALAYARHAVSEDLLRSPGEQDLTAHVSFTALERWGLRSGLQRTGYVTQLEFLAAMGRGNEFADLYDPGASEVQKLRARLMLKTLLHPEGMGETFRVLIQHKGMEAPHLTGLAGLSAL